MRLARSLLRDSSNTISSIAEFLGYCDVYFFTRQFKKFNGISPGQFRNVDFPKSIYNQ